MKRLILMGFLLTTLDSFAGLKENKALVISFYDLAFNQHRAKEAALKFLSEDYIQHNPHVATGRKAFIEAFEQYYSDKKNLSSTTLFKRTIAEGDLVVLHSHKKDKANDRGVAGIDIFRVQQGKIVEHWDVNQKIPEVTKNSQTMF